MAKRRYSFDEEKIARFQKEGRGQGVGSAYRPWLTIHDVPSTGRATRIHSRKTGREHHLLSDLETSLFFMLDWSDAVIDIREQFPLERDITLGIAAEMGVQHPADSQTKIDIVMTTDFLLDIRGKDSPQLIARSVKPSSEFNDPRTLEKQEIERRYWQVKGIDWGLVTELDLPTQRIKNLRWLHEMQSFEQMTMPYPDYWNERCNKFLDCVAQNTSMSIKQFTRHLENSQGFAVGEVLTVLRHLAANKRIKIDLDAKFDMLAPIESFSITTLSKAIGLGRKIA